MRWILVVLVTVHGLIHLAGFGAAFSFVRMPGITKPFEAMEGLAHLAAGLALILTAVLVGKGSRFWWIVGLCGVSLSQAAIVSTWTDAGLGTLANLFVLAGVVYGFASRGPMSLHAVYSREVAALIATPKIVATVQENDIEHLPEPVRRYLDLTGFVGAPRVHHFEAVWRGRIRSHAEEPWMNFRAEQHNSVMEPARFFLMDARRNGLPVDVLHRYANGSANMRVRLLSMVPLVNNSSADLDRAETVTVFNDLCLLAPGGLVDASITWETLDNSAVRAHYTLGSNRISAVLHFNERGELVNFVSDDRLAASRDGAEFKRMRWSTPVTEYKDFGKFRVFSRGEGKWHPPEGDFVYLELELVDLQMNG
jgi:hypothetical protein